MPGRAVILATVLLAAACSSPDDALIVAAASSTAPVLDPLVDEWAELLGRPIEVSYSGSSAIREQVRSGAPVDVVLVADEAILAELTADGLTDSGVVLASNAVVMATRSDDGVSDLAAALDPGAILGVCAPGVPCGDGALDAAALAGVELMPDTEEPNVRSLLRKLLDGEVDAAAVYRSDVATTEGALVIVPGFEDASPNRYVAATVEAESDGAAQQLLELLSGAEAREAFADAGFGPP